MTGQKYTVNATMANQLKFADLVAADSIVAAEIWEIIEPNLTAMLSEFYKKVQEEIETPAFTQEQVKRLIPAQIEHWRKLFKFDFSTDYENSVRRVGIAHHRIDLKPQLYVAGYTLIQNYMLEKIYAHYADTPEKVFSLSLVLNKLISVDMGLALSVYQMELL